MAYEKTNWEDRIVEKPNTFTMQQNSDETITLIPAQGQVIQQGTQINASNLNKIEDELVNVNSQLDSIESEIATINKSVQKQYYPFIKGGNILINETTTTSTIDYILNKCVETGINGVYLAIYHYQGNSNDTTSNVIEKKVAYSLIEYTIIKAKQLGIEYICIKPHVSSNSNVNPSDKTAFLNNWFAIVNDYVTMSLTYGLTDIVISNELSNLDSMIDTTLWVSFINLVKAKGVKVGVTFAGFNRYSNCKFVQELDFIGVNYYPIVKYGNNNTDILEVKKRMYSAIDFVTINKILKLNKPFYISEIGCTKYVDGMTKPPEWVFTNTTMDNKVHQLYYEAFYTLLGSTKGITNGIFIWALYDLTANKFNPFGNPLAEEVIKSYIVGGDE